jgi:hypothetical protein
VSLASLCDTLRGNGEKKDGATERTGREGAKEVLTLVNDRDTSAGTSCVRIFSPVATVN